MSQSYATYLRVSIQVHACFMRIILNLETQYIPPFNTPIKEKNIC